MDCDRRFAFQDGGHLSFWLALHRGYSLAGPCFLVIQNFKMAANKRETENQINKYYSYVELLFFLSFMPVINGGMK